MKNPIRLRLNDLNDRSIFISWSNKERKELFKRLLNKMSLSDFSRLINYDIPTMCDIKNGKVKPSGYVYLYLLKLLNLNREITSLKISSRNFSSIKIRNPYINLELIGLIHSDGSMALNKKGNGCNFYFCNKNKVLIKRFKLLLFKTFICKVTTTSDLRDKTYYVFPPNIIARLISKKIGWKTKHFQIPCLSEEKEICSYLRGLFDGDGTIYLYQNSNIFIPTIRITTGFKRNALDIQDLLDQIGIYSRICYETRMNGSWYNVVITRREDFIRFVNLVGSSHPKKSKKMEEITSFLSKRVALSTFNPTV